MPLVSRRYGYHAGIHSLLRSGSQVLTAPKKKLERAKGFEPSTCSMGSCHSTTELSPREAGKIGHLGALVK
jgi:hypothetical protein